MKELREMNYDQLIEYSAQVNKEVRRRAYGEGYRQGKFDAEMERNITNDEDIYGRLKETPEQVAKRLQAEFRKTRQDKRDRIAEQAKVDVEKLLKSEWPGDNAYFPKGVSFLPVHYVEFVNNTKKRTVVALVRGLITEKVYYRGIAKCAPDDCFNVHIGKAIALRRALGLEVPAEYMSVPQPTEVRVGDIVNYEGYRVTVNPTGRLYDFREGTCAIGSLVARAGKIIDDSREVFE